MPDDIDIERQRHQLPPLLGELPQVLEQLLGVRPTIGPRQVPDVDGILDLGHDLLPRRHAIPTVSLPERFRRRGWCRCGHRSATCTTLSVPAGCSTAEPRTGWRCNREAILVTGGRDGATALPPGAGTPPLRRA